MTAQCEVCFRQCRLEEGQTGFCGARENRGGMIIPKTYGQLTAIALDPIEKKPLARFFPGSMILSVGSYGCSMACPFCQNHEIARPAGIGSAGGAAGGSAAGRSAAGGSIAGRHGAAGGNRAAGGSIAGRSAAGGNDNEGIPPTQYVSPEELALAAARLKRQGNIGVAYTYNEMTTAYEYIRDTAKLIRAQGMKNVLVTNGNVRAEVLETFLPYIDAMNIDLKCFSEKTYREVLSGDLPTVKEFIRLAAEAGHCHVELTTLIVPGMNDTEEEMREACRWIASLAGGAGREIPLHVTRFFPRFRMSGGRPTPVRTVYRLADVARETLKYVYTGNC